MQCLWPGATADAARQAGGAARLRGELLKATGWGIRLSVHRICRERGGAQATGAYQLLLEAGGPIRDAAAELVSVLIEDSGKRHTLKQQVSATVLHPSTWRFSKTRARPGPPLPEHQADTSLVHTPWRLPCAGWAAGPEKQPGLVEH